MVIDFMGQLFFVFLLTIVNSFFDFFQIKGDFFEAASKFYWVFGESEWSCNLLHVISVTFGDF